MSVSAGRFQLADAFKSLKQEWQTTEIAWRDVVRKDFAQEYWDPLEARLNAVLSAMDRLDLSLGQMKQDCE